MDDMRQDAVMQQFFALINNVLQESPDTQKRKLRIVTYKVHIAPMLLCQFCMEQACQCTHYNRCIDAPGCKQWSICMIWSVWRLSKLCQTHGHQEPVESHFVKGSLTY